MQTIKYKDKEYVVYELFGKRGNSFFVNIRAMRREEFGVSLLNVDHYPNFNETNYTWSSLAHNDINTALQMIGVDHDVSV